MTTAQYPDLFKAGADMRTNACLNFQHDMSYGYVEGYRRAADILVSHVEATGRDQDFLVYPIAFAYRQHLELQLKRIIDVGRKLLTDCGGHPTHHKLRDLWPVAKSILRQVWPDGPDPGEFQLIDNFVEQFSQVDYDSTAFRYPVKKAGGTSLHGVRHINLRNLAECVQAFSGFLDGAMCGLSHYLDEKYSQRYESELN